MKQYKSSSMVKPIEWDTTSCPVIVYHNFNVIEEVSAEGTIYKYDVIEYSRDEYHNIQLQDMNSAIDDILVIILEDK